jgi:ribosome-binding protein aMBF1 (putative translation factor)
MSAETEDDPTMDKDRMRELLAKIGWSQHECARRLHVDSSVVRKYCRGYYKIPDNVGVWLERLAAIPELQTLPEGWEAWDQAA